MADDDDDGIVLNLNHDEYKPIKKFKSQKETASRNGNQPWKDKSTKNKEISQSNVANATYRNNYTTKPRSESTKAEKSSSDSSEVKRQTTDASKQNFEVISSLFSKNPEIPQVPTGKAQENKSSDLFMENTGQMAEISPRLTKALKDQIGFENFTKVQQLSIPAILSGKDVLIKSPTGSGKTLAYALPVINQLQKIVPKINRKDGPYAIVLLPTRELALQSYELFESLCRTFVWIVPGLIVGGEKRKAEKSRIRKGINILVATPGRLLDHLATTESLSFKNVSFMIFDEADRLLDLGFQESIVKILTFVKDQSQEHQTALLSATLNPKVENLASISLKEPVFIDTAKEDTENANEKIVSVGDQTSKFVTPDSLKQYCAVVPAKLRLVSLLSFILKFGIQRTHGKVIVFFSSKSSTEFHFSILQSAILKEVYSMADCAMFKLHGDMQQQVRSDAFKQFKKCSQGVLFCTDVAARGLDLPSVNWIVQYSCPSQIDDYVHRVGRTARIGAAGKALLFLLPSEVKYIEKLREQNIEMEEMKLFNILTYLLPVSVKKRNQSVIQDTATDLQTKLEEAVINTENLHDLAELAFKSFIQSYATYPSSLKEIFHLNNLHFGHIAKSFALRTAPQHMDKKTTEKEASTKKRLKNKAEATRKRKFVDMSEEGVGLMLKGPTPGGKRKSKAKKK